MKIFGLVGKSIDYSFSPNYFNQKFHDLFLDDHFYRLFPLDSIEKIKSLDLNMLCGFNVTIPYKEAIIPYLDGLSEEAALIGAVNTVQIDKEGLWTGYNTDAFGFELSLSGFIADTSIKHALILGSGGASKAVSFVLEKMGISYRIVSRTGDFTYEDLDDGIIKESRLIINTTPLGMSEYIEELPQLPYNFIREQHYLFDLIYNPEKTLFLKKGEQQGACIQNGYDMLVFQAEKAWEIWNQKEIIST